MKKLFILLLFFGSVTVYCQEIDFKKQLDDLKSSTAKNKADSKKIKDDLKKYAAQAAAIDSSTTQMVIYDFKTKKYEKANLKPIVGEPLVFKIININRLSYEIEIKSTDVAIADENFAEEKKIISNQNGNAGVLPSATAINEITSPNIDTTGVVKQEALSAQKEKDLKKEEEKKKGELSAVVEAINSKESSIAKKREEFITQFTKEKTDETTVVDTLMVMIDASLAALKEEKDKLLQQKNDLQKELEKIATQQGVIKMINVTFEKLQNSYTKLFELNLSLYQLESKYQDFRCQAMNPLLDINSYHALKTPLLADFFGGAQSANTKLLADFERELSFFYSNYNQAINNYDVLTLLTPVARENTLLKYKLVKNEVDKLQTQVKSLDLEAKFRKVMAMDKILSDPKGYEMASSPIQPLEDYVTFDIKIKHRDDKKQSEYTDDREFTYMEYTKGGVRFDFSTGVAFDFPLDKQDKDDDDYYDAYSIVDDFDVNGNPVKRIVGTSRSVFTPTLAGMFHTSFRRSGIWAFGLTLGASLNVETFQLNSLFPGLSLLIGKKQKFIFTAGPAFKQMNILKKNYSINEDYTATELAAGTDLTSKQFKIGIFFSISYNLTQTQRAKFKIGGN